VRRWRHGSEEIPVTASSELDNESCDFMKGDEFLEQFQYYQGHKIDYDQWSYVLLSPPLLVWRIYAIQES
jgi:hypothetical protein